MSASIRNPIVQRICVLIAASVIGITSIVSLLSIGEGWAIPTRLSTSELGSSIAITEGMELPHATYRDKFETSCLSCHSPRLALNQPTFSKKKWGEIVHKMVAAYGAPITKVDEPLIVKYLLAVQATR